MTISSPSPYPNRLPSVEQVVDGTGSQSSHAHERDSLDKLLHQLSVGTATNDFDAHGAPNDTCDVVSSTPRSRTKSSSPSSSASNHGTRADTQPSKYHPPSYDDSIQAVSSVKSPLKTLYYLCLDPFAVAIPHANPSRHHSSILRHPRLRIFLFTCFVSIMLTFIVHIRPLLHFPPRDADSDETVFQPFYGRRSRGRGLLFPSHKLAEQSAKGYFFSAGGTRLYYPPNCANVEPGQPCAKIIPSFMIAGGELSGSEFVYETLLKHPQIIDPGRSGKQHLQLEAEPRRSRVFDSDTYDASKSLESFLNEYNPLPADLVDRLRGKGTKKGSTSSLQSHKGGSDRTEVLVGDHAPNYLYGSHLTAKRIKEILPDMKLIFLLRDPIDRAFAQYLRAGHATSGLSFETFMDVELQILRRCGHTSTQTGWAGFVQCHQGSEIRASWNMKIPLDGSLDRRSVDSPHVFDSLARGMYMNQLEPFLQHFHPSQMLILRAEDVVANASRSFQTISLFLGIDETVFGSDDDGNLLIAQQSSRSKGGRPRAPLHSVQDQHDHHTHRGMLDTSLDGKEKIIITGSCVFGDNAMGSGLSAAAKVLHHMGDNLRLPHGHGPHLVPAMAMEAKEQEHQATQAEVASKRAGMSSVISSALYAHHEKPHEPPTPPATNFANTVSERRLNLATRYRLQKVFGGLNNRLSDMFEDGKAGFEGWDYDVSVG